MPEYPSRTPSDRTHTSDYPSETPVLFYDGQCALCDGFVGWVLPKINGRDAPGRFWFAPLQGRTAARLLDPLNPAFTAQLNTVVLLSQGRLLMGFQAILAVLALLEPPWPGRARRLSGVPPAVGDLAYWGLARLRRFYPGKANACERLPESLRRRILP